MFEETNLPWPTPKSEDNPPHSFATPDRQFHQRETAKNLQGTLEKRPLRQLFVSKILIERFQRKIFKLTVKEKEYAKCLGN